MEVLKLKISRHIHCIEITMLIEKKIKTRDKKDLNR